MKLGIISGSHRDKSESDKVARYIQKECEKQGASTYLFSLSHNPLPLWDEGVWGNDPKWKEIWGPIAAQLQGCDGFVVISPEWAGMVPPGLKNFLLLCSPAEVGHKPGLIVTVSSGIGGSYPVNELRTSSYKNNRLCYIPEHVIVRSVGEMLGTEDPTNDRDSGVRKRITFAVTLLRQYATALKGVRESGVINYKDFQFGM
jgi:NAD(P)H-dependent FMN reductase